MTDVQQIIEFLGLSPLPVEGGYYRETYRTEETITHEHLPRRYSKEHALGSAIYYLLTDEPDSFSALHKLLSDEVWHFYLGDPVEMLLLYPDGGGEKRILGKKIAAGQLVQTTVYRDTWQGARLVQGGKFALMGTTVTPGFDPADFTPGNRDNLIAEYPEYRDPITLLTRR